MRLIKVINKKLKKEKHLRKENVDKIVTEKRIERGDTQKLIDGIVL